MRPVETGLRSCWKSRTPETGGLELLVRLRRDEPHLPVILISARGDVPTVVQAMKAGALNFLQKPVRDHELREAIQEGFQRDRDHRQQAVEQGKLQQRITRLSAGERDVLRMLIDGKSNKTMATDLAMSVRTIEVRRAKLMQKMKAGSLAELVRLAIGAGESLGKPDGRTLNSRRRNRLQRRACRTKNSGPAKKRATPEPGTVRRTLLPFYGGASDCIH